MAAVYVIYSQALDRFYTGSCLILDERIAQHNNKVFPNAFTTAADDWMLLWSVDDLEYDQPRKIEAYLDKTCLWLLKNEKLCSSIDCVFFVCAIHTILTTI